MKHSDPERLPDEARLLEHYRSSAEAQPSAALDALILAAAREAVAPPRPTFAARLRGLLALPQRHALAFGSLASVVLVLGLVLNGLPDDTQFDDRQAAPAGMLSDMLGPDAAHAPAMASPPPRMMASPAPVAREMARLRPAPAPAPAAEALAESEVSLGAVAPKAAAPVVARSQLGERSMVLAEERTSSALSEPVKATAAQLAKPPLPPFERLLREVVDLRAQGHEAQAQVRLQALRERYPRVDVQARLEALEQTLHSASPPPQANEPSVAPQ